MKKSTLNQRSMHFLAHIPHEKVKKHLSVAFSPKLCQDPIFTQNTLTKTSVWFFG